MNSLNATQIRYLKEVLGVEQILWKPLEVKKPEPRLMVFAEINGDQDRSMLSKMLQAMKLESGDFEIHENPTDFQFSAALSRQPIMAMIFGESLAESLGMDFSKRGKFMDQGGIATLTTYGPQALASQPELKAEAWKDMKLAMGRLA